MDNKFLRDKRQEFLENNKDNPQYMSWSSVITRFIEYCEKLGKNPQDFTMSDFERYLSQYSNPITITHIKGKIQTFLEYCGYDVKGNLPETRNIVPELDYILSFEELKRGIDKVREEQYELLGIIPRDPSQCDNYTVGEVVIYLAWLGIPRDMVATLPLNSINLEKKCIEYQDGNIKRIFSFADYPVIEEVFANYKNAQHFISFRNKTGRVSFINNDYYGDNVIRSGKPPKNNGNIVLNTKGTLNRIFSAFEFAGEYKNVYFSGAFSRGYDKIMQGNLPEFTPNGIMSFFGVIVETESSKYSFKRQWNDYLTWRLAAEGKELSINSDNVRMTKMKSIAVKCISTLNSFPEDKDAKIEMTAKDIETLMLAIYNFGKNSL